MVMDPRVSRSTGGVEPMGIAGRMVRERERLLGMSKEERAWRAQWVKDQHLAPNEPVHVPEYWRERINPIRRFYRAPLDGLYNALKPMVGHERAIMTRFWAGKALLTVSCLYLTAYYFKYNSNDWTRKSGWRVISSKTAVNYGDAQFPKASDRNKPSDYASRGFNKDVL